MAKNKSDNITLSEAFLEELFFVALKNAMITGIVSDHIKPEFLPDKEFQKLHAAIRSHYKAYKEPISYGKLMQKFDNDDGEDVVDLISEVRDNDYPGTPEALIDDLEKFIVDVKSAQVYEEFGQLYKKSAKKEAQALMIEHSEWLKSFTLKGEAFVEVISTFEQRHTENAIKNQMESQSNITPVNRFYIDDLDALNDGRSLRGQVACFLASSGVGKSHIARHVGKCAAQADGLDVLHFQLEGSKEEVLDAYSGGLIEENSFNFEKARLTPNQLKRVKKQLADISGTIRVRAFPRFNNQVSTIDIVNGIAEYRKATGKNPDMVIIDSMDLLTDASGKNWQPKDERHKRIAVVNDLKDIAGDENCFLCTTTQATISDREWLNDPKNVLTEYNAAEAKGIVRPLTWLISLNQTEDERNDNQQRLHVAKSRFTKKGGTFKIATDYDNEVYYDRERTMQIQRLEVVKNAQAGKDEKPSKNKK